MEKFKRKWYDELIGVLAALVAIAATAFIMYLLLNWIGDVTASSIIWATAGICLLSMCFGHIFVFWDFNDNSEHMTVPQKITCAFGIASGICMMMAILVTGLA